jgi:Fe-S cluster assembly protein SufB
VETGSAITWKYPSCVLRGAGSVGEFYSVATVNNHQQADTGTKMIHIGPDTRSTIISKGISAGHGQNTYRGLVKILPSAHGAVNMIVSGFCKSVFKELPMEFAVEAQNLLAVSLEGAVG